MDFSKYLFLSMRCDESPPKSMMTEEAEDNHLKIP